MDNLLFIFISGFQYFFIFSLKFVETFNINKEERNDISSELNNYILNIYNFPFPRLLKPSSFIEKTKYGNIIEKIYNFFSNFIII